MSSLTCSRPLLCEEQFQEIREARNKKRIPQTLAFLSIKAFALHSTRFVDIPDCPLKYLRKLNEKAIISVLLKLFVCSQYIGAADIICDCLG
jgi:hypothetical protein